METDLPSNPVTNERVHFRTATPQSVYSKRQEERKNNRKIVTIRFRNSCNWCQLWEAVIFGNGLRTVCDWLQQLWIPPPRFFLFVRRISITCKLWQIPIYLIAIITGEYFETDSDALSGVNDPRTKKPVGCERFFEQLKLKSRLWKLESKRRSSSYLDKRIITKVNKIWIWLMISTTSYKHYNQQVWENSIWTMVIQNMKRSTALVEIPSYANG